MAKGTIIFFFSLSIFATLLFGINLGKKLVSNQLPATSDQRPTTIPSPSPTPTIYISPILTSTPSAAMKKTTGKTTYTDNTCGFSFSYPGSFIKQKSVNQQATIITDPDDPTSIIAVTCAASIPRPPVTSDKIEAVMLDKVAATLYHDQNQQDGSPRDEVIVKHPANDMEIILAGYGSAFQQVLNTFKFIK